jgi:hypothetical protein
MIAGEITEHLIPDLPAEDRVALGDILDRDLVGNGRGWLRPLVTGGDLVQARKTSLALEIDTLARKGSHSRQGAAWTAFSIEEVRARRHDGPASDDSRSSTRQFTAALSATRPPCVLRTFVRCNFAYGSNL